MNLNVKFPNDNQNKWLHLLSKLILLPFERWGKRSIYKITLEYPKMEMVYAVSNPLFQVVEEARATHCFPIP